MTGKILEFPTDKIIRGADDLEMKRRDTEQTKMFKQQVDTFVKMTANDLFFVFLTIHFNKMI